MKILSIGNSFSQDAQKYLHAIAASDGVDLFCANLYIGGCNLAQHDDNLKKQCSDYDYEINGEAAQRKISINEAVGLDDWDVVTLQQASYFSGMRDTYSPYIENLFRYVKKMLPNAEICLHETWAFEKNSDHPGFRNYDCNQQKMYDLVQSAYYSVAADIGAPVIPVGDVIQHLRTCGGSFDSQNGIMSLTRDGFHLSLVYGRYAAGLTWYATLTGNKPTENVFIPQMDRFDTDPGIINELKLAIENYLKKREK